MDPQSEIDKIMSEIENLQAQMSGEQAPSTPPPPAPAVSQAAKPAAPVAAKPVTAPVAQVAAVPSQAAPPPVTVAAAPPVSKPAVEKPQLKVIDPAEEIFAATEAAMAEFRAESGPAGASSAPALEDTLGDLGVEESAASLTSEADRLIEQAVAEADSEEFTEAELDAAVQAMEATAHEEADVPTNNVNKVQGTADQIMNLQSKPEVSGGAMNSSIQTSAKPIQQAAQNVTQLRPTPTEAWGEPSKSEGCLSMTLSGQMTLKLKYEFEGQEVTIGFVDQCLKVELSDGTEFKIPVKRKAA